MRRSDFFFLCSWARSDSVCAVITLAEIQTAADALSPDEKQQLMQFLAARLRAHRAPVSQEFPWRPEKGTDWMAEDEAAMRRFRPGE